MAYDSATAAAEIDQDFGDFESPSTQPDAVSAILKKSLAAFHLPQIQPQAVLATSEKSLSSKAGAPGHADSGYASVDGGSSENTPGPGPSLRNLFQRKVTKLKPFNKEISDSTKNRFKDLTELFEQPLYEYLIKARLRPTAISIKLKVLGESEATANPWIVILCDGAVEKRVKQFFNQQNIKSEYQPYCTDSDMPFFDVYVCSRRPRPMAATAVAYVYGDLWDATASLITLCGKTIKVNEALYTRFATLGGTIKITDCEDNEILFGMTAGHILAQGPEENEADLGEVYVDAEGDESSILFKEEEESFELELSSEDEDDQLCLKRLPTAEDEDDQALTEYEVDDKALRRDLGATEYEHNKSVFWKCLGCVAVTSRDTREKKQDLDWALIALDDPFIFRPNLLANLDVNRKDCASGELRELSTELGETEPDQPVVLLSGASGLKHGKLSASRSLLMLAPGKSFISTYNLALDDGLELNPGDCGSWVVNTLTLEVYGHVIAADVFGEAYVVPLGATFRQIKQWPRVKSVCLPVQEDICRLQWSPAKIDANYLFSATYETGHEPKTPIEANETSYPASFETVQYTAEDNAIYLNPEARPLSIPGKPYRCVFPVAMENKSFNPALHKADDYNTLHSLWGKRSRSVSMDAMENKSLKLTPWLVERDRHKGGEIDIEEGVNSQGANATTLHTSASCTVEHIGFSKHLTTANCDTNARFSDSGYSSLDTTPLPDEGNPDEGNPDEENLL